MVDGGGHGEEVARAIDACLALFADADAARAHVDLDEPGSALLALVLLHAREAGADRVYLDPSPAGVALRHRIEHRTGPVLLVLPRTAAVDLGGAVRAIGGMGPPGVPRRGSGLMVLAGEASWLDVSTYPTAVGDAYTLSGFVSPAAPPSLERMFDVDEIVGPLRSALSEDRGVVLVTGAMGSGKSTVLYGMASEALSDSRRMLTIEESPGFYDLPGAVRGIVGDDLDTTALLRAMAANEPDVAVAADLRSADELKEAFTLSRWGCLVLGLLDAPDALSAFHRIVHLWGIERSLLGELRVIVALRLAQRSCPECQVRRIPTADESDRMGLTGADRGRDLVDNLGCDSCEGRGTNGRSAVAEVLELTDGLARELASHDDVAEMRAHLGGRFIDDDIRARAIDGSISIQTAVNGVTAHVELTSTLDQIVTAAARERPALPALSPGQTVTIVFTDLVSSTAHTAAFGDQAWMAVLRHHTELVRKQLAAWGGTEVKSVGDGFMLAFPSAAAAVRCGLEVQESAGTTMLPDGRPVAVRVGVHAGEPVREGDDFFGTTVNVAARVNAAAVPGEVLVSDLVRALIATSGGFEFGEGRAVELKGLEGSHVLYPVTAALDR